MNDEKHKSTNRLGAGFRGSTAGGRRRRCRRRKPYLQCTLDKGDATGRVISRGRITKNRNAFTGQSSQSTTLEKPADSPKTYPEHSTSSPSFSKAIYHHAKVSINNDSAILDDTIIITESTFPTRATVDVASALWLLMAIIDSGTGPVSSGPVYGDNLDRPQISGPMPLLVLGCGVPGTPCKNIGFPYI